LGDSQSSNRSGLSPLFSPFTVLIPPRIPPRTPIPATHPTIRSITIAPLTLALITRTRIAVLPSRNILRRIPLAALRVRAQTRRFLIVAAVFAALGHGAAGVRRTGFGIRGGVEFEVVAGVVV